MIGDWVMVAECVADAHFIDYPDKIESIRDGLVGLESDGLETIIERIAPIPPHHRDTGEEWVCKVLLGK